MGMGMDEMGRACSTNGGEKRNAYRIFVRKPVGKRPLGRLRRRWVDNIKMDLREIGWDGIFTNLFCFHTKFNKCLRYFIICVLV
jgi:hypothetical protein